ncbi:MAG: ABC transporter ATP-binding protein [Lachnospiraceae bacterium]
MEIVRLNQVTKIYGKDHTKVLALDHVNLTIEKGETVALCGSSGSGKSTLLHMIGGIDVPTEGEVIVDGKKLAGLTDEEMSVFRRRKIGFIFQAYHLIPVLTVEENITMPVLLDHRKPDKEYVEQLMDMLGIVEKRKNLPAELSGGQQQRVAIARALANRPTLILADEPTGALDSKNGEEVMTLLQNSVRQLKQTLIMVTHNPDLAREMDRIVKITDGKIG